MPLVIQRSNLARLAAGPVALAFGLGGLAVALGPGRLTTYAGRSGLLATLTVAVGFALVLAGLVTSFSRATERIGNLAVLAGLVWFAPLWVGWDKGPPLVRSLAMLAAGFTFPLLLHLALAYPSGQLRGTVVACRGVRRLPGGRPRRPRWGPVSGPLLRPQLLGQLHRQPVPAALAPRPRVRDRAGGSLVHRGCRGRAGNDLLPWRLLRDSGPARRALLPVALPAILLAATTIAYTIALQRMPREDPSDPAFRTIFVVGCAAVILLAAGLVWAAVRTRVQRRAVARIATSLGQAPPPGSLQAALAQAVGDPELRIAYWLS